MPDRQAENCFPSALPCLIGARVGSPSNSGLQQRSRNFGSRRDGADCCAAQGRRLLRAPTLRAAAGEAVAGGIAGTLSRRLLMPRVVILTPSKLKA
jgi:hypothetical protein